MDRCEFVRRKPKSQKTKRAIERKQSLVNENPKKTLYLHGEKTSDIVKEVQRVIQLVQSSPNVVKLNQPNKTYPFETTESLEFLGFKNDCSLFCFGSHSKKRPHNIVIGRQFAFKVIDMMELGIRDCNEEPNAGKSANLGTKPAMVFVGPEFEFPLFERVRNLLLDFFGGAPAENLNANGLDRVIVASLRCDTELPSYDVPTDASILTFPENKVVVSLTHLSLRRKDGGTAIEVTPDSATVLEFSIRRVRFATPHAFTHACKQPDASRLAKGLKRDAMGDLRGQVHVGKQEVDKMTKRRFKRAKEPEAAAGSGDGAEGDDNPVPRRRKLQNIPDPSFDI